MGELDVVDQLAAVTQSRPLRPEAQLPLLRVGQEVVVGLHQVSHQIGGLVEHFVGEQPVLFREDVGVSDLLVCVLSQLLGVSDDLHLWQFLTAEGRAAYIGPLVLPRVSVACRSTSPPCL